MFEQTFVNTQVQTKKPWTVAASLTLQIGLVGVAILMPLLHPGVIHPDFNLQPTLYLTKLAQPPAPPEVRAVAAIRRPRPMGVFIAPTTVPRIIDMTPDPTPDVAGGIAPSVPIGLPSLLPETVPLPPVLPPAPPAVNPKPPLPTSVRVSAGAQLAKLIFAPKPAYPALGKAARVQGTVRLQAIIARDGMIQNLRVISGPPLLVQAAIDAVRQWRYQPTLLSGEPVEVETTIDVNFTLN
jgi:protein TonB